MKQKPLIGVIAPVLARSFMQDMLRGAIAQLRLCGCNAVILAPLIQFESAMPTHAQAEQEIFRMIDAPDFDAFLYLKDEATMGQKTIDEIVVTVNLREESHIISLTFYGQIDRTGFRRFTEKSCIAVRNIRIQPRAETHVMVHPDRVQTDPDADLS